MNKKAVLGNILTTFIATILIAIILLIFILASGFVKMFSSSGDKIEGVIPRDINPSPTTYTLRSDISPMSKFLASSGQSYQFRYILNCKINVEGKWIFFKEFLEQIEEGSIQDKKKYFIKENLFCDDLNFPPIIIEKGNSSIRCKKFLSSCTEYSSLDKNVKSFLRNKGMDYLFTEFSYSGVALTISSIDLSDYDFRRDRLSDYCRTTYGKEAPC